MTEQYPLNPTDAFLDHEERNKILENWRRITAYLNDLRRQVTTLAGNEDVDALLQTIDDQINAAHQAELAALAAMQDADQATELALEATDLAEQKAQLADDKANLAQQKVEFIEAHEQQIEYFTGQSTNLQAQINQLVVAGDSSPEAAQARIGVDATVYPTLKARVDAEVLALDGKVEEKAEQSAVDAVALQLAQTTQEVERIDTEKVTKIAGKTLSTNDFTNTEKTLVSQIPQKANTNEVRENTLIRPINVNEFDTETKALFTGGAVAVVGADAVGKENLKYESVDEKRVTFLEVLDENLYNQAAALVGKSIRPSDGALIDGANFVATDYIEVEEGKTYIGTSLSDGAFYTADKVFISGRSYTEGNVITIPQGARYVRYTISMSAYNSGTNMLVKGTSLPINFRPYNNKKVTFKNVEFAEDIFDFNLIEGINKKAFGNLYNQNKAIVGKSVRPSDGALVDGANYVATDYIEVKPNVTYKGTSVSDGAFYDAQKNYISGRSYTDGTTFTAPNDAKYVRYTISRSAYDAGTNMLVEGSILPSTFIPYKEETFIPSLKVEQSQIITNKSNVFSNLTFGQLGDSWTASNGWQPTVMNELGFKSSHTEAVIGSRIPYTSNQTILSYIDRYQNLPNCDVITIMGGINGAGVVPIGQLGTKDNTTHIGALQIIIEWYLTRNPNVRIFIMTPGRFWNYGAEPRSMNTDLINYNNATKQVAEFYGLPLLDLYNVLGVNELTRKAMYSDGVHPTSNTDKRIGRMVAEFIRSNY